MKSQSLPLFIRIKDVQRITGWSERTARKKMTAIRKQFNKPPRTPVLVREFCQAMKFTLEDLVPFF
ncbi:MAG TPA: hypothetical protein VGM41_06695 [Chitinophagaceae bacterium]